jgi:DnaJ-class molecular chaperone
VSDAEDNRPDTGTEPEPIPCPPCRGTGAVISNLGGAPTTVTCPWCEGTGVFRADHDAQAARRGDGEPA